MPFSKKCASYQLHEDWNIETQSFQDRRVAANIRDKLLELCNKTLGRDFYKADPAFCQPCVHKLLELHPELLDLNRGEQDDDVEHSDNEDEPPYTKIHLEYASVYTHTSFNTNTNTNTIIIIIWVLLTFFLKRDRCPGYWCVALRYTTCFSFFFLSLCTRM